MLFKTSFTVTNTNKTFSGSRTPRSPPPRGPPVCTHGYSSNIQVELSQVLSYEETEDKDRVTQYDISFVGAVRSRKTASQRNIGSNGINQTHATKLQMRIAYRRNHNTFSHYEAGHTMLGYHM